MKIVGCVLLLIGVAVLVHWRFKGQYANAGSRWYAFAYGLGAAVAGIAFCFAPCLVVPTVAISGCVACWQATRRMGNWNQDCVRGVVFGLLLGPVCAIPAWLWLEWVARPGRFLWYLRRYTDFESDMLLHQPLCALPPFLLILCTVWLVSAVRRWADCESGRRGSLLRILVGLLLLSLANFQIAGAAKRLSVTAYAVLSRPGCVWLHTGRESMMDVACNLGAPIRTLEIMVLLGGRVERNALGGKHDSRYELIDFLASHGADVNEPDFHGRRLLCDAAAWGDLSMVELLIRHGANVNAAGYAGERPLHATLRARKVLGHDLRVAQRLVENGADVNGKNGLKQTPLHISCLNGDIAAVGWLLAQGTDVCARDRYGDSPLRDAVCGGHSQVVDLLLRSGAPLNKDSTHEWSSLHECAWITDWRGGLRVAAVLIEHTGDKGAGRILTLEAHRRFVGILPSRRRGRKFPRPVM